MPISMFRRALSRIHEIGVRRICITGGEPTEHPSFLELVRSAHQFGLSPSLVTSAPSTDALRLVAGVGKLLAHLTLSVDSLGEVGS